MLFHYLIGNGEFIFSFMHSADGKHTKIIEQTHEIVRIDNIRSRKAILQFSGDISLTYQGLYDGGIMSKLLVLANQHPEFFVVYAYVAFYHFLWRFAAQNIVFDKIENHVGIVQGGFSVAFRCEAVVVIPRLHDIYQLADGMVERTVCGIIRQHLTHFLFRESCHFVELW